MVTTTTAAVVSCSLRSIVSWRSLSSPTMKDEQSPRTVCHTYFIDASLPRLRQMKEFVKTACLFNPRGKFRSSVAIVRTNIYPLQTRSLLITTRPPRPSKLRPTPLTSYSTYKIHLIQGYISLHSCQILSPSETGFIVSAHRLTKIILLTLIATL